MTRWQDYEEKLEKVSWNDELLINSWGIVKRVQAIQFRWEQGIRWIWISRIESRKTGKNTFVEVFNTENVKIWSFTIQDWVDWNDWENWADWAPWVDWTDWENGVGIVNISSTKSWKITTLIIELSNWKNYEFSIQDWIDGTGAWDMLSENNLSDLSDKVEARMNLDVYAKSEIKNLLKNKIDKEAWKGLSSNDFTFTEKQKLANLENFSKNYDELINKPIIRRKIQSWEDLNNIKTPWFYYNPLISETRNILNIPPVPDENKAFWMIVYEASWVIQEWTDYNTATKWIRRCYADNWTEWKRFDYIEPDTTSWKNKKTLYWNQNYYQIWMRIDSWDDYWIERHKDNFWFTRTVFTWPSIWLNTTPSWNLWDVNKPSIAIWNNTSWFRADWNGSLEMYVNNDRYANVRDNYIEFNKTPFTTQPQHSDGHSLVRKDYVDWLVANIPKVVWKTENITSNSAHQEFIHNLNILQEEFFKWRYIFYAFYQDWGSLRILNSFSNYAQRNWYSGDNSIWVYTNKVQFFARYIWTLRKVLIIKNY